MKTKNTRELLIALDAGKYKKKAPLRVQEDLKTKLTLKLNL